MTFSWEAEAKRNAPMPAGLPASEQLAYQSIAALVARWRMGVVTAEQAKKERKQIDQRFLIDKANEGYIQWTVDLRKRIEVAQSKYRLERTIEAADLLSDVLDGFVRI
jgi:hypothetical protein